MNDKVTMLSSGVYDIAIKRRNGCDLPSDPKFCNCFSIIKGEQITTVVENPSLLFSSIKLKKTYVGSHPEFRENYAGTEAIEEYLGAC